MDAGFALERGKSAPVGIRLAVDRAALHRGRPARRVKTVPDRAMLEGARAIGIGSNHPDHPAHHIIPPARCVGGAGKRPILGQPVSVAIVGPAGRGAHCPVAGLNSIRHRQ